MTPSRSEKLRFGQRQFGAKENKVQTSEEKFVDEKKEIQKKAALKGREQVPKLINKPINKRFLNLKYDPYDVKAILHPIDFVVFNGMNSGQVTDVTLLSGKTENPHTEFSQRNCRCSKGEEI